ncbi:hypothetical protein A9Y57_00263 [Streptococcus parauberis]|uniref:DUF3102 domain-containing protein n=1 Tax=Streptococcus parauberis TaxID=1348 RepID=A0A854WHT3_9STRE|nr:DUF3102 domain-containing protein [Streptococcus parauberis]PCH13630.1 hypothetical protein A9Y57_00263 [Streptococcus parauberis]
MYFKTCLEWQCQDHKNIAGQSIWEIGRRLNHVKENDLAHGQFIEWLEKMNFERTVAHRMMKIAIELPNVATLQHLSNRALYLISTLPDEEKEKQIERVENEDVPKIKEIENLKRKLKDSEERNKRLAEHKLNIACNASILVRDSSKVPPSIFNGACNVRKY